MLYFWVHLDRVCGPGHAALDSWDSFALLKASPFLCMHAFASSIVQKEKLSPATSGLVVGGGAEN
jgi:hypothetical protein